MTFSLFIYKIFIKIPSILDGKHYNRSIKANKIIFEVLYRCYWSEFEPWSHEEDMEFRIEPLTVALN